MFSSLAHLSIIFLKCHMVSLLQVLSLMKMCCSLSPSLCPDAYFDLLRLPLWCEGWQALFDLFGVFFHPNLYLA
jgi:hypothetical protein